MALTNAGTAVYLVDGLLPAGYTRPTVTKFTDHECKYEDVVLTIGKTGVDEAAAADTFTALVAAVTAAVTAYVTADFNVSGLTVNCYANLKEIATNFNLSGVLYTTGAINYLCKVDIFVKTAAL